MDKAAKEGFSKSKAITPDEDFRNGHTPEQCRILGIQGTSYAE